MDDDQRQILASVFTSQEIRTILDAMYTDDAASFGRYACKCGQSSVGSSKSGYKSGYNRLLKYPEDSAGSIMTVEYIDVTPR